MDVAILRGWTSVRQSPATGLEDQHLDTRQIQLTSGTGINPACVAAAVMKGVRGFRTVEINTIKTHPAIDADSAALLRD